MVLGSGMASLVPDYLAVADNITYPKMRMLFTEWWPVVRVGAGVHRFAFMAEQVNRVNTIFIFWCTRILNSGLLENGNNIKTVQGREISGSFIHLSKQQYAYSRSWF
jgi:hypothetical protein